jgi:hypothetical protein
MDGTAVTGAAVGVGQMDWFKCDEFTLCSYQTMV